MCAWRSLHGHRHIREPNRVVLIYVLIYICDHIKREKNEVSSDTGISGSSVKEGVVRVREA